MRILSKGKTINLNLLPPAAYFEPLLLYLVLFFSAAAVPLTAALPAAAPGTAVQPQSIIEFSAAGELIRLITYTIPALGLIWYLILKKNSLDIQRPMTVQINDFYSLILGLPGLILISALTSFLMTKFPPSAIPPKIRPPFGASGWIVMVFSCAGTGYLEESFFRFYLLQKLKDWIPRAVPRILFAVLLFTFCHGYEGPWGMLNAALAGILLSILFEKFKTIHGLAWAHACYNAFVYITGIF
ncbi:MAG: CPBP family intramembrane metalloprotease [Treponema sp.]|nr:CPBP family intramembrane metalloprotease [Treponema sp.]